MLEKKPIVNPVTADSSPAELRDVLRKGPMDVVRISVASHANLPEDMAISLSRDFNPAVRLALLNNEAFMRLDCAQQILKRLALDYDVKVHRRAESLLKR